MSNLNAIKKQGDFFFFFQKKILVQRPKFGAYTFIVGRPHSPSESDLKLSRLLHDTSVVCSKNSKLQIVDGQFGKW